jgi:hypothetical protein
LEAQLPVLGFRLTVRIVIKITSLGRDPRDDSQRFSRFPVQSPWRVILICILFILGIHLPPGQGADGIYALPLFAAFFAPKVLIGRWGIRKFRREWIERGDFARSMDSLQHITWCRRYGRELVPFVSIIGLQHRNLKS